MLFFNLNIVELSNKFLPIEIYDKFSTLNFANLNSLPRIDIWHKTYILISKNIFFGYGAGSFSKIYSAINGSFGDIQHSHNIFLELTYNFGIIVSI